MSVEDVGGAQSAGSVPLPKLVEQLLKNCSLQSLAALKATESDQQAHNSGAGLGADPGLNLLLQFQRLLLLKLYSTTDFQHAANSFLTRYITWLCEYVSESLLKSIQVLQERYMYNNCASLSLTSSVASILRSGLTGIPKIDSCSLLFLDFNI